jgi:hypothetical protein
VSADFGRPVAAENPVGQRTGGAAEAAVGVTAAEEEDTTTTTMAADRERKSG